MQRLHLFGGGHAIYWRGAAAVIGIVISMLLLAVLYFGLTIWKARRRRRQEDSWP